MSPTVAGISCSWCNISYHASVQCQVKTTRIPLITSMLSISQEAMKQDLICGLGVHSGVMMPPHWILKLPRWTLYTCTVHITGFLPGEAGGAGDGQSARQSRRLDGQGGAAPRGQGVLGVQARGSNQGCEYDDE